MNEVFPWFSARLLFEACVEGEQSTPSLFEERFVLVHAVSGIEAASRKAEKFGKSSADVYVNEFGESVTWRFKEVLDLVQLSDVSIGEGSEVYHQYLTAEEVDRVRQSLKSGSL
jgi:hypothetical protein